MGYQAHGLCYCGTWLMGDGFRCSGVQPTPEIRALFQHAFGNRDLSFLLGRNVDVLS